MVAESFDKEMMTLLLDQRTDDITITTNMVKAATGNYGSDKEVMILFLKR